MQNEQKMGQTSQVLYSIWLFALVLVFEIDKYD